MKDDKCKLITSMINSRLDKFEEKLDHVIRFYWIAVGAVSMISLFLGNEISKLISNILN